jgi:hypothetical protein
MKPLCDGNHPGRTDGAGLPYDRDRHCWLCWCLANEPWRLPHAAPARSAGRPGSELASLLHRLGFPTCGQCQQMARQMDSWGVSGCRQHLAEIHDWLQAQAARTGLLARAAAGVQALAAGLPLTVAGLVAEAIRRAEAAEARPFDPSRAVHFIANDHRGLGDRLILLAVAAGYKERHPTQTVFVEPGGYAAWLDLFDAGCVLSDNPGEGVRKIAALDGKYDHWHRYDGRSPWECCAALAGAGVVPRLPPPRPWSCFEWVHPHAGAVVLCPFAAYEIRCWPLVYWLKLESLLLEAGYRVVILDAREERCRPFQSPKMIGRPAHEVAALLRSCCCLVGNDSGMQHVAGLLGTPTVVLAAVFKGFTDLYPGHKTLSGGLACDWCHQDYPKGGLTRVQIGCAGGQCQSLRAVSPQRVFEAVRETAVDQRRRDTTAAFLNHLEVHKAKRLVETGCQRADCDYGAGMSTTRYGVWCAAHGAELVSLDNDAGHVAFARDRARHLPVCVEETDSVRWLVHYAGPPLDGLYLDSLDVSPKPAKPCEAPFEQHCRAEAREALRHLAPNAAILIDDTLRGEAGKTERPWSGKGALAIPWLESQGWQVKATGYQVLLVRG